MSTYRYVLCGAAALVIHMAAGAVDFDSFKTDEETDKWLRDTSPTYARMVKEIKSRKNVRSYRFVTRDDIPAGLAKWADGSVEIQLSTKLKGPRRITTLIFETANVYRSPEHRAIDLAVDKGLIRTQEEFGLAHEIYEYEALRLQRQVLIELESRVGALPKDFFYLVTPPARSAKDYRLPGLYQYLKTQKKSGHTAHYYKFFHLRTAARQKPKKSPSGRR